MILCNLKNFLDDPRNIYEGGLIYRVEFQGRKPEIPDLDPYGKAKITPILLYI